MAAIDGILPRRHRASRRRPSRRWLNSWVSALVLIVLGSIAAVARAGEAPLVYQNPFHEGPVRGGPDDLLLIAGYGFRSDDRVVYALETESLRGHPASIPDAANAEVGLAQVVSSADIPYSLTVRLPATLRRDAIYDLWVVTRELEWSDSLRINDPRPLWFSPGVIYSTVSQAGLPRTLKIVGRNLASIDADPLEVRLAGPMTVRLGPTSRADRASDQEAAVARYAVEVALPGRLPVGHYRLEVRRAPANWTAVGAQELEVRADPVHRPTFSVGSVEYGGCRADGKEDAARCLARAIEAALAAHGGVVDFGPGIWRLGSRPDLADGFTLPLDVDLRGAGASRTTLIFGTEASPLGDQAAVFTLAGHNEVSGFTFVDEHRYRPEHPVGSFFRLGPHLAGQPSLRRPIEDVTIEGNVFDRPNVAIAAGGGAISRLTVTHNEVRAYREGLALGGNRFLLDSPFDIRDSVIAHNVFEPGSYMDLTNRQGAIASELGAATRVDFSDNLADGASIRGLYSADDPRGWRAAFFWHMNNNVEMLLVANNVATCTGDKDGDGEAIAFDNDANTFALSSATTVTAADRNHLTVIGPLAMRQEQRDVPAGYYIGHWIQVGAGPGIGEVRKIVAYDTNPADGRVRFEVEPAWDVVPAPGVSRVSVGREYWQVYTIGNRIDERQPLCRKSNRTRPQAGVIGAWAQTADSVIEANQQFDSDGILFRQHYDAPGANCPECQPETNYVDFLEIRGNVIDGEYDWTDGCSSSGIIGSLAAAPTSPPPIVGYGIFISHNVIARADGRVGGGISLVPTWYEGPEPHRWPLSDGILIFHNLLSGFADSPARPCQGLPVLPRTAIKLSGSLQGHVVLHANQCAGAQRPFDGSAQQTAFVCDAGVATCGCPSKRERP